MQQFELQIFVNGRCKRQKQNCELDFTLYNFSSDRCNRVVVVEFINYACSLLLVSNNNKVHLILKLFSSSKQTSVNIANNKRMKMNWHK